MRIYRTGLALIIFLSGVGVSRAAEKGPQCEKACQAANDKCSASSTGRGTSAYTRCNWDYQQCLGKCK